VLLFCSHTDLEIRSDFCFRCTLRRKIKKNRVYWRNDADRYTVCQCTTYTCVYVCVACVYLGRKKSREKLYTILSSRRISGPLKYLKGFSTTITPPSSSNPTQSKRAVPSSRRLNQPLWLNCSGCNLISSSRGLIFFFLPLFIYIFGFFRTAMETNEKLFIIL